MNQASIVNLTKKKIPRTRSIESSLLAAMKMLKLKRSHVCLSFVSDARMKKMNLAYRNKNKTTDVLSFAQNVRVDGWTLLGDIVISVDTAKRQAFKAKKTYHQELLLLYVHGLLHLIGYDHATKNEEDKMFGLQNKLIERINAKKI